MPTASAWSMAWRAQAARRAPTVRSWPASSSGSRRACVMRDAHAQEGMTLLAPRWAMSFLRGPMTRSEIKRARQESTDVRAARIEDEQSGVFEGDSIASVRRELGLPQDR